MSKDSQKAREISEIITREGEVLPGGEVDKKSSVLRRLIINEDGEEIQSVNLTILGTSNLTRAEGEERLDHLKNYVDRPQAGLQQATKNMLSSTPRRN
jgi:transcriptional regulator of NAD metabolism